MEAVAEAPETFKAKIRLNTANVKLFEGEWRELAKKCVPFMVVDGEIEMIWVAPDATVDEIKNRVAQSITPAMFGSRDENLALVWIMHPLGDDEGMHQWVYRYDASGLMGGL